MLYFFSFASLPLECYDCILKPSKHGIAKSCKLVITEARLPKMFYKIYEHMRFIRKLHLTKDTESTFQHAKGTKMILFSSKNVFGCLSRRCCFITKKNI